ncbi:MAG: hypothetical protein JSU85_10215 [Candidatus Zixiibacteriota bacterium]|nr:MAG: hypothetical protein JSU85_10215 [candidate division Zixibacteria bacterium]
MTKKTHALENKPSHTLVIHCVDHRFQQAFRGFIVNELGIAVFNPIVIAGGTFALSSEHFSRYAYIWDQVDFFITKGDVRKVILINHDDCLWYKKEKPDLETPDLQEKGKIDLVQAANNIKEKYPEIEVVSVWAELSGDSIRFNKIN